MPAIFYTFVVLYTDLSAGLSNVLAMKNYHIFVPHSETAATGEKLMNAWLQIHRNGIKKNQKEKRGANEQTPPVCHASIFQMCHTGIHDSADCVLMKLGIMTHFTLSFQCFVPNLHHLR